MVQFRREKVRTLWEVRFSGNNKPFCGLSLPVSCFLALKPGALYFCGDSLDANGDLFC